MESYDTIVKGIYIHTDPSCTRLLKFIYSEKATKFCNFFPLLLTECTVVKSKVKISQNFVAFSEYMKFKIHKFWEGHKILQNLHLTFDYSTFSQK